MSTTVSSSNYFAAINNIKVKPTPVCGYKTHEFVNQLLDVVDLKLMKVSSGYIITDIDTDQLNNTTIVVTVKYTVDSKTERISNPDVLISSVLCRTGQKITTVYDVQYTCSLSNWTVKCQNATSVTMSTTLTYVDV